MIVSFKYKVLCNVNLLLIKIQNSLYSLQFNSLNNKLTIYKIMFKEIFLFVFFLEKIDRYCPEFEFLIRKKYMLCEYYN